MMKEERKKRMNGNRKWQWGGEREIERVREGESVHCSAAVATLKPPSLLWTGLDTVLREKEFSQVFFLCCGPTGHYVEVQHYQLQQVCECCCSFFLFTLVSLVLVGLCCRCGALSVFLCFILT